MCTCKFSNQGTHFCPVMKSVFYMGCYTSCLLRVLYFVGWVCWLFTLLTDTSSVLGFFSSHWKLTFPWSDFRSNFRIAVHLFTYCLHLHLLKNETDLIHMLISKQTDTLILFSLIYSLPLSKWGSGLQKITNPFLKNKAWYNVLFCYLVRRKWWAKCFLQFRTLVN